MSNKPATKDTELAVLLQSVLDEAGPLVASANGSAAELDDDNIQAQLSLKALSISERRRKSYRSVQAAIVTRLVRANKLWLAHPPTDDYPNGFGTLREFLLAAGISSTTACDLCRLEQIVPFCDKKRIPIDRYLGEDTYPKLVEAGPTLKQAALDGDKQAVKEVLDDVTSASGREAIRHKYAEHRDLSGQGAVHRLEDGRVIVLLLMDDDDAIGKLVQRLSSDVGWKHLVSAVTEFQSSIRVTIDDV